MWTDETATISDEYAELFKSKATTPLLLLDILSLGIGIGLGILGTLLSLVGLLWIYIKKRNETEIQKVK